MSGKRRAFALAAAILAAAVVSPLQAGKSAEVRTESFRLLNEGVAAYNRGEYKEAAEKLGASASMALNSYRAYYYLGLALIGDRRAAEAVDALTVALDLDPSQLLAHVAMGDAQLKRGDSAEASAAYYRALKLRSEYAAALDGIARTYEAQEDDEKALAFYRRAIASNKGYAESYVHLGDLLLRQGRLADARSQPERQPRRHDERQYLKQPPGHHAPAERTPNFVPNGRPVQSSGDLNPDGASHSAHVAAPKEKRRGP